MTTARRVLAGVLCGALIGAGTLAALYRFRSVIELDMDRPLPRAATGFYNIERSADGSFAWTSERATLRLAGLDRGAGWACTIRFRGVRPQELPSPTLDVSVDGLVIASRIATNGFDDLEFRLPERRTSGLTVVAFTSTPVFVPGGHDPRALGVQVDRLACKPVRAWVLPPPSAMGNAARSTAIVAGAVVVATGSVVAGSGVALVLALAVAVLLTSGAAMFGPFPAAVWFWSACTAVVLAVSAVTLQLTRRRQLTPAARGVLVVTSVLALIKLLGLLHPAKPLVDALFQAHRFESVLAGHYFFTQPMPSGVAFPYAIGLYLFAAPWSSVTRDFVTLLRVVVIACEAATGALLYLAAVRSWGSARAALAAVVFYHLVLLTFAVIGNGNLTNAFGQSAALGTLMFVAITPPHWRRPLVVVAVAALAALAMSSHVSTAALLGATLGALIVLLAVFGGRVWRPAAAGLAIATVLASGLSIGFYYRHFDDVFANAWNRVRAATPTTSAETPMLPQAESGRYDVAETSAVAGREALHAFGWPLLLLTLGGACTLGRKELGAPIGLVVLAWAALWLAATGATVLTQVGPEFERYAAEFLGRVNLAIAPGVALLAGRSLLLPNSLETRFRTWPFSVLVGGFAVWATVAGVRAWLGWFT